MHAVIGGKTYEEVYNLAGQKVGIAQVNADGSETVVEENGRWGASPLAVYQNGQLNYEHQDWIGTERLLTDASGKPAGGYASLPFGDGYMSQGADIDPYHYAGLDHDYESGLDHAQYREYANAGGRWLSPDPYAGSYNWADPQSLNRYLYVENNPLSASDPSGLFTNGASGGGGDDGLAGFLSDLVVQGFEDLFSSFLGGPSFHGSLAARPGSSSGYLHQGVDGTVYVYSSYYSGQSAFANFILPVPGFSASSNPNRLFLPPDAQSCIGMGKQFYAPPQFNLNNVIAAGQAGGRLNLFAMNRAVGHFGTFDYQRVGAPSSFTFYKGYTPVSNIDVGAYLYGAGFSQSQAGLISNTFADLFSSNAGDPGQAVYRNFGYQMASGKGGYTCSVISQ